MNSVSREESKEVSTTRLASRDAAEAKSIPVGDNAMATSETVCAKRELAPVKGAMDTCV